MDKSITAEWARKTVKSQLSQRILNQIAECEVAIVSKVKNNENVANVFISLDKLTITELESRGFEVNRHDPQDQRDSRYYEIKW